MEPSLSAPCLPPPSGKKLCDHLLCRTGEHESLLLDNSPTQTFLKACQLCDSFTALPPAIPVPESEKETTVLHLQVTDTRVRAQLGTEGSPFLQSFRIPTRSLCSLLQKRKQITPQSGTHWILWKLNSQARKEETLPSFTTCPCCVCTPCWNIAPLSVFTTWLCCKLHKVIKKVVFRNRIMSFKHRMVTQIAKIGLSLSQSPWLSIFFLKAFVGSDTMELRMEIATIVVTAVQVLPNPVHKEICCLSGGWASFTLLKAKVSKQGPLGEESPHPENCHDILYAQLCQEKRKIGFKLTKENTKEIWSAPHNMVEQPLNCGFAFGECAQIQNSGTCWNSQYILMKFELMKNELGKIMQIFPGIFCSVSGKGTSFPPSVCCTYIRHPPLIKDPRVGKDYT